MYIELSNFDLNFTPELEGKINGLSLYWIFDSSSVAAFHTGKYKTECLTCIFKKKNYHSDKVFPRFYFKLLACTYGNSDVHLLLKVIEVNDIQFQECKKRLYYCQVY